MRWSVFCRRVWGFVAALSTVLLVVGSHAGALGMRSEWADVSGGASATASFDSVDLGVGESITLLRPAGRRTIDIPVAGGLVLTGLRTTVTVPSTVNEVQLDMTVGDTSIFSAVVPGGSVDELEIVLENPIAVDTVLSIAVEERHGPTCTSTAMEPTAVQLTDNEFIFQQVQDRTDAIADFFPPVLHHANVVLDPGDPSLRAAGFELATALARRYPVMPSIDVVRRDGPAALLPPTVSDDPFARTIVLVESEAARMRVVRAAGGSYLEIGGPPGLVERVAAAVSETELGFVTEDSVRIEELGARPSTPDLLDRRSLRDVGVRRLEASGSRVLELPIPLPQSAFGEPVDEILVRLGGVALASSTSGRDPVLTLWLNGDLQDSIDYDESGRFDLEFVLDRAQIERDNVVVIRSEVPLDCGDDLPTHELTLDAGSWVDAHPGQSLPPSLDRFPQVAVGRLSVATGPTDGELELAMATLGMLQGSSPLPIHPEAATIQSVLAGFSTGLVVSNGEGLLSEAVDRDLTTVRSEQLAFVSGDSRRDLAVVSAGVTNTAQDLVVVLSPSRRMNRAFFDVATDRGWSAFVGNAVGVRGDRRIVRSEVPETELPPAALSTLADPPQEEPSIAHQFGLGALAAVLLVAGVVMVRFVLGALRRLR